MSAMSGSNLLKIVEIVCGSGSEFLLEMPNERIIYRRIMVRDEVGGKEGVGHNNRRNGVWVEIWV